jgi:hypothetical protein
VDVHIYGTRGEKVSMRVHRLVDTDVEISCDACYAAVINEDVRGGDARFAQKTAAADQKT